MKTEESHLVSVISGNEDTIKISTVVFFVLGLIVPFWIFTLPFFWFVAYRTFKSGEGTTIIKSESIKTRDELEKGNNQSSKFDDLERIKALLDSGVLTKSEFDTEKAKILNERI